MAKLIFLPVAKLNGDCLCCILHKPGLYRAVWDLKSEFDGVPTEEDVLRFAEHPVFGMTVCVN